MAEEKVVAEDMGEERKAQLANLAKEKMGNKFRGEVPVAEDVVEAEEEVEIVEEEEAIEETEETEEVEIEEDAIQSFDELIEQIGLDEEKARNLKLRRKVNGQESEITVGELLETNQTLEAARTELNEAKAKANTILQDAQKQQKVVQEELGIAARLIEDWEKSLTKEEQAVNWEQLKADDPSAYAVKRMEFEDRRKNIEGMKAKAREDFKNARVSMQEDQKKALGQYIEVQQKALFEAIPEWKDMKVAEKEGAELNKYLMSNGVTPEELNVMYDHRFYNLGRKAMLYDKIKAEAPAKTKKIAAIPKTMKPGAAKSAGQIQTRKLKDAQTLLAKKPTAQSALEVLRAKRASQR